MIIGVKKLLIRQATLQDARNIASVHIESWQFAYKNLMHQDILNRLDIEARTKSWENIIAESNSWVFIAIEHNVIAGFVHCCPSRELLLSAKVGEITAIYLKPYYLRKGIGTLLLTKAIEYLQSQGYGMQMLWVLEKNIEAINFYKSFSFKFEGKTMINPTTQLVEHCYINY
jgi:ribosomal protein S18 acetylase RimI-like enzyme